jgi:hypothetical protein
MLTSPRCLQHLIAAARHFREALKLERGNIFAANGLGAVCATMGQLEHARQIFSELRESAATLSGFVQLPDVRHHPTLCAYFRAFVQVLRRVVHI